MASCKSCGLLMSCANSGLRSINCACTTTSRPTRYSLGQVCRLGAGCWVTVPATLQEFPAACFAWTLDCSSCSALLASAACWPACLAGTLLLSRLPHSDPAHSSTAGSDRKVRAYSAGRRQLLGLQGIDKYWTLSASCQGTRGSHSYKAIHRLCACTLSAAAATSDSLRILRHCSWHSRTRCLVHSPADPDLAAQRRPVLWNARLRACCWWLASVPYGERAHSAGLGRDTTCVGQGLDLQWHVNLP